MNFLAISLCIVLHVLGGDITPDPIDYLQVTTTSASVPARYLFRFRISTQILQSSVVTIEFPHQFSSDLGLKKPTCFQLLEEVPLSVACTVTSRTITIEMTQLFAGLQVFGIMDVRNPDQSGGTGTFKVKTYKNGLVQDLNEAYPPIGISPAPLALSASVQEMGSLYANYSPLYALQVALPQALSSGWVRMVWPIEYSLSAEGLKCYWVEQATYIPCSPFETWSTYLQVYPTSLPTSFTIRIYGLHNPHYAGTTGSLTVEIMDQDSFRTLYSSPQLPGFTILPGPITNVKVEGAPLNHNLLVWYTLAFRTFNDIPEGGRVLVTFPGEFQGCFDCALVNGATALAGELVCFTKGLTATFQNLAYFSAGEMVIQVQAQNPVDATTTSQFLIQTYTSDTHLIDQNLYSGVLTFSSISAPKSVEIEMFEIRTEVPFASFGPLELYLQTYDSLPPTTDGSAGLIEILCPPGVETDGSLMPSLSQLSCLFGKARIPASSCTWSANTIKIGTPQTEGLDCCPLAITITTIGSPTSTNFGFRVNPLFPGLQQFTINVYVNGVVQEQEYYFYTPAPKDLSSAVGVASAGSFSASFMHATTNMWNYIQVALMPSVSLPAGGTIEFEFMTSNGGFARDLGWGLRSFQSTAYPCIYDNTGGISFSTCEVVAGTTVLPAYIRLSGLVGSYNTVLRKIYLPNVMNGAVLGAVQTLTVRTITSDGITIEQSTVKSLYLLTNANTPPSPNLLTSSLSIVNNFVSASNTDATFHLSLFSSLNVGDGVYILFPSPNYSWPNTPSSVVSTACASGIGLGSLSNYLTLSNIGLQAFVYTAASVSGINIAPCLRLPLNVSNANPVTLTIYIVQSHQVTEYGVLNVPTPTNASTGSFSVTELLKDTSKHLKNQRTLYELSFQVNNSIKAGGGVAILFPVSVYSGVDLACFDIVSAPSGATCSGTLNVSYNAVMYHIVTIQSFTNLVTSPTVLKAQVWATTATSVSGVVTILAVSYNGSLTPAQAVDNDSTTLTIDTVSVPASVAAQPLVTPLIDMRINEFAPLVFSFKPQTALPATSLASLSYIQVTLPQAGSFTQAPGSYLDCRLDGLLSSNCVLVTTSTPNVIKVYTSSLITGTLLTTSYHTLVITTRDATIPSQIGFQAPSTPGNYEFILGTFTEPSTIPIEQSEVWVTIAPARLLQASITSICKGAGQWNTLLFDFRSPVVVNSSLTGTSKGAIWLQFPYDFASNGQGWKTDFGAGYSVTVPLDCVDVGSTSTLLPVNGQFSCQLVYGYSSYFRVMITGFNAVAVNDHFRFYFGPVKNPTAALVDFTITVSLEEEDLSVPSAPVWNSLAEQVISYIDTTMTTAASILVTDSSPNSNKFLGSPVVYGIGATLQLNVVNTIPLFAKDNLLIKLYTGYIPASAPTTCTITPNGGAPTTVPICVGFPLTGWLLIQLPINLPNIAPTPPYTLTVSDFSLAPYSGSILITSFYIRDRKVYEYVNHPDFAAHSNQIAGGTCTLLPSNKVELQQSQLQGYLDTYSFTFTCPHLVPKTGQVAFIFPVAYTSIQADSCVVGPRSQIPLTSLTCVLQNSVEVHVSGFPSDLTPGTTVQILISAINPSPAASYKPFKVQTYYTSVDNTKPTDSVSDNVGVAVTWSGVLPQLPSFTLGEEPVFHSFKDLVTVGVSDNKIGPLSISMTSSLTVTHNLGFLTITSAKSVALDPSADLLCIWNQGGIEHIAVTCTLIANTVTITAPKNFDIVSGTSFTVTITSRNANVEQGLTWTGGEGTYALDLAINDQGTGVNLIWRTYVEVKPAYFPNMSVFYDHVTIAQPNRLRVAFTNSPDLPVPASSAGGRLYLEFSSSVFSPTLGLGSDNSPVSCKVIYGLAVDTPQFTSISCYLRSGNVSTGDPARVIVTGFKSIPISSAVDIHFDKIYNPAVAGDDVIVDVTLVAVDISAGWPGVRLAARTTNYLYSAQANVVSSIAPSSVTVQANGGVGQTNGLYNFPIIPLGASFAANDLYVIFLDPRTTIGSTFTCTGGSIAGCLYYPGSNSVFFTITAVGAAFILQIGNFNNPNYQLVSGLVISAYLIRNSMCVLTVSYLPSAIPFFTAGTLSSVSVLRSDGSTTHFINDQTDLIVRFTTNLPVPSTGAIQIDLPTGFSVSGVPCYNYNYSGQSQLTGVISCTYSSPTFTITNFDNLAGSSVVAILINVKNSSTAGASQFNVKTINRSTALLEIIEKNSASITLSSPGAPTYHEMPLQFQYLQEARAGSVAPFQLYFYLKSPLTPSGFLTVSFASFTTLTLAPGGQLICFVNGILCSPCTLTGTSVKLQISSPNSVPVGTYPLVITTRNANSYELQGIQYPSTPNNYAIKVTFDINGNGSSVYYVQDFYTVLPTATFTSLNVEAAQVAVNSVNSFTISVTLSASADTLSICFPTQDSFGNSMFANDLGTGLGDPYPIPCTTTIGGTFYATILCSLYQGNSNIARPACIQVNNFTPLILTSGTSVVVIFDNIQNPPVPISDTKHVHIAVYAYLSNVMNQAQTFYDVMTLSFSAPTLASATDSNIVHAFDTTVKIDLPTNCQSANICVVQLPPEIGATASCTGCVFRLASQWLVFSKNVSTLTITVQVGAIPYTTTSMVAMYYLWATNSYGIYVSTDEYTLTLTADFDRLASNKLESGPVYGFSTATLPANTNVWYVFSYKLRDPVPNTGCIQLILPVSATSSFCFASGDSTTDFYSFMSNPDAVCAASSTTVKVTGFSALSANSIVSLVVQINSPAASNKIQQTVFHSFYDTQCSYMIEEDSGTNKNNGYNTVSSINLPTVLMLEEGLTPVITRSLGQDVVILFRLSPVTALTVGAGTSIQLSFQDPFTQPVGSTLFCDITDMATSVRAIASSCTIAGVVLKIVPNINLVTTTTYEITVYTRGAQGIAGLTLPTVALNRVSTITLSTFNLGAGIKDYFEFQFYIPTKVFSDLEVDTLHVTAGQMNMFSITFTSPISGAYNVVVEFPCQTETWASGPPVAPIPLFENCLGTGFPTGSSMPCMSWTPNHTGSNTVLSCTLYCGQCAFAAPKVKTAMTLTSGSVVHFSVLQVYNPVVAASFGDRAIVHIRVYIEDASTGVILVEGTVRNLFAADITAPVAYTSFAVSLDQSNTVGDKLVDALQINYKGGVDSKHLSAYFVLSTTLNFKTSCDSGQCNFPNQNLGWARGSWNSVKDTLKDLQIVPLLATAQGQVDLFLGIGDDAYQSYALNIATSTVVDALNPYPIKNMRRFLSYYGKNTWQFNRLFFDSPIVAMPSDAYIQVFFTDGTNGDNADEDQEFLEFTENWTPSVRWKYDFTNKCFVITRVSSIPQNNTMNLRFLVKTSNTSPSLFAVQISSSAGLFGYGQANNTLGEDPIGGFAMVPAVTFTSGDVLMTFKVGWQMDSLCCTSGLTRVNLMDVPFGIDVWSEPSKGCDYMGNDGCDSCPDPKFRSGEIVEEVNAGKTYPANSAITLALHSISVAPGWHSMGVILPYDQWELHTDHHQSGPDTYWCECGWYGSGCGKYPGGKPHRALGPRSHGPGTDCKWDPCPNYGSFTQDAVAVIFNYISVPTITAFSSTVYYFSVGAPTAFHFAGTVSVSANDLVQFGFQNTVETPSSLGYTAGDSVPFFDPATATSDCWVTDCGTSNPSGTYIFPNSFSYNNSTVTCQVSKALTTYEIYLLDFTPPASWNVAAKFTMTSYTFSAAKGGYTIDQTVSSTLPAFSTAAITATAVPLTLANPIVSALNTINLAFSVTTGSFTTNDIIFLELGYAAAATGMTAGPVASYTFAWISTGYQCPCLLAIAKANQGVLPSISITAVPNPADNINPKMTGIVFQASSNRVYIDNFSAVPSTPGTLSAIVLTAANPPFYPSQEAFFSLSFKIEGALPLNGLVKLTFPAALFRAVSAFKTTANITGNPLIYTVTTSGGNNIITVTGISVVVAGGTTVTFTNLWCHVAAAPLTSNISVGTFGVESGVNKLIDNALTASVTVTGLYTYLSSTNLWFPPAFRSGQVTPNGNSDVGVLSLYFQVATNLGSSYGQKNPAYIQLSFNKSNFKIQGVSYYGVFYDSSNNAYLAYGPDTSGSTTVKLQLLVPRYTSLPAASTWRLEIGCYNKDIGITMDPNASVDFEIGDVDATTKYTQTELIFPIGTRFTALSILPLAVNSGLENYIEITMTTSGSITDGQIVVEFPLLDYLSGVTIFSTNLGYSVSDNDLVPCTLYQATTLQSNTFCRFYSGSITDEFRERARVVLFGATLAAGSPYTFIVGGFLNPVGTALRTDLKVYTRSPNTNIFIDLGDGIYQYSDYAFVKPMMTAFTQALPLPITGTYLSSQLNVLTTNVGWTITSTPGIPFYDFVLFKLPSILSLTTISSALIASSTTQVYLIQIFDYILIQPNSPLSGTSASVFSFSNMSNPPYLLATWNAASAIISSMFFYNTYSMKPANYSPSAATPMYTIGTVTGSLTILNNALSINYSTKHTVTLTVSVPVSSGGYIEIAMPSGYQSLGTCLGNINNNAVSADCTINAGKWTLQNFSSNLSAGSQYIVFGTCKSPAISGTQTWSVAIWADTGKTQSIAAGGVFTTPAFINDFRDQDPNELQMFLQYLAPALVRTTQNGPVTITFQPATVVPISGGTVVVSASSGFSYTAGSFDYLVCKFIDSSTLLEYRSPKCTSSAPTFTVETPPNTALSTSTKYSLRIFTTGLETSSTCNGILYPNIATTKSVLWTVLLKSGATVLNQFIDQMRINSAYNSFSTFKAYPVSLHAGDTATIMVNVDYAVPVADGAAIIFPASLFSSSSIGAGLSFDQNADCFYSPSILNTSGTMAECHLRPDLNANMSPRSTRIELYQQAATSGVTTYYIPNVTNPSAALSNVYLEVTVYKYNAGVEELQDIGVLYNIFQTIPAFVPSIATGTSFTSNLGSTSVGAVTTSSVSFSSAIPASSYVIFALPHVFSTSTTVTSQLSSHYVILQLMAFPGATVASGTPWAFSSVTNPAYAFTASSMSAVVYSSGIYVGSMIFSLTPQAYTVVNGITAVDATYDSGPKLYNMPFPYKITLKSTASMPSGGGFQIIFSAGTPSQFCQVVDITLPLISGAFTSCSLLGSTYIISNLGTYTANTSVSVKFTMVSSVPFTVSFKSYLDAGTWSQQVQSGLFTPTLTTSNLIPVVTAITPISKWKVIRIEDVSPIIFSMKLSTSLTASSGHFDISFPSGSLTYSSASGSLRCVWINGLVSYLAKTCTYTTAVLLSAGAPAVTPVASGQSWSLMVTTVNQNGREGLNTPIAFRSAPYWLYGTAYGTTATATEYGGCLITFVPIDFNVGKAYTFSGTTNQYSALQITITPDALNPIGNGFGQGAGSTEIILQFGKSTYYFSDNLGTLVNTGTLNYGQTDCFQVTALTGVQCYLMNGKSAQTQPPQVWLRNYVSLGAGVTGQFVFTPFINPSSNGQIVHLRLFVRTYSSPSWTYNQYREFDYVYMTESNAITSQAAVSVVYSQLLPQTVSTVQWSVAPSSSLAVGALNGVLLKFTSMSNALAGATMTTHTLYILGINYMYFVIPGAALPSGSASILTVNNVPTPNYCVSKLWGSYIMVGSRTTDSITYASVGCADYDVSGVSSMVRVADPNVPNHLIGRVDTYLLYTKPAVIVLLGGQIIFTVPATYTAVSSTCQVITGLTGPLTCAQVLLTNSYSVTGFNAYNFASANAYIVLSLSLTAPTTTATATPFTLAIYGVAGDTSTHTETASFSTFNIVSASSVLNTVMKPWYWEQQCAYLTGYAAFIMNLSPGVTYPYMASLYVDLPVGATLSSGTTVLMCTISNGVNIVPSEGGCSVTSGSVLMTIPEQLPILASTPYTVSFTVRDSGSVTTNGFLLSSAIDITVAKGNPTILYWYLHAENSSTLLEAAKIGCSFCGKPYTTLSVSAGHCLVNTFNFFDLTFESDQNIPATGYTVIEFQTNNELSPLFDVTIGQTLGATSTTGPVDCVAVSGSTLVLTCTLYPATTQSSTDPAIVRMQATTSLGALTVYKIRFAKLMNPIPWEDPIFGKPLMANFKVYTRTTPLLTGFIMNAGTAYRIFDKNGLYDLYTAPLPTNDLATAVIGGPSPPNYTVYPINAPNYIQYNFLSNGISTLSSGLGAIIFVLDVSFPLPLSGFSPPTCSQFGTTCVFSAHSMVNWIVMEVTAGSQTPTTTAKVWFQNIITPINSIPAGYSFAAYVISGAKIWTESYSAVMPIVLPRPGTASVTTLYAFPNRNTYSLYQISVDLIGVVNLVKRVDYIFPAEFQWVDATCREYTSITRITGGTGNVICQSDCDQETCTKRVTVSNFQMVGAATSFSFKIGVMNPVTSGVTSNAQVFYYTSPTDTTAVVQSSLTAGTWNIQSPTYSFDVWIQWPTKDLYSRTVFAGDTGQIFLRFRSSVFTPPSTGTISIQFPEEFDIAPGGTPQCTLGYGDVPFANFPQFPWIYGYQHVPANLCTWQDRVLTMHYPDTILRQWYGTGTQCAFFLLTTSGSTNGIDGFRAPLTPGYYDLKVYAMDGSYSVLEASFPQFYVSGPAMPSDFSVYGLVQDVGTMSKFVVKFTTQTVLLPGYSYLKANGLFGDTTAIEIQFGTYQSFAIDLSTGLKTGQTIPCIAEAGLIPHSGVLQCTLTLGDVTQTTPQPALVTVSDYEKLAVGTLIQICFPKLLNPVTVTYIAKVSVGVYRTTPLGFVTWLYTPTYYSPYAVTAVTAPAASLQVVSQVGTSATTLDTQTTLQLPFTLTFALAANDYFVLDFPAHFSNLPSNLQLTIVKAADNSAVLSNIAVKVYPLVQRVVATLLGVMPSALPCYLLVSNMRLPQFIDSTLPGTISYFTVNGGKVRNQFVTGNIFTVLGLGPAIFSDMGVAMSSNFAGDVDVKVTIVGSLQANLPIGAVIVATLPTQYPSMSFSVPIPVCSSTLSTLCSVSGQSVSVSGFSGSLIMGTNFSVFISGVKAPASSGPTSTYSLTAYTSSGELIAASSVSGPVIDSQRLPLSLPFAFNPQFKAAGITNVFTLTVNSIMMEIPSNSILNVNLPSNFTVAQSLQCAFLSGITYGTSCQVSGSNSFMVPLNNAVTTSMTITIRIEGIQTPKVPGPAAVMFAPVLVSVTYDNTVMYTSSVSSPNAQILLWPAPPGLFLSNHQLTPSNEAEYSQHSFTLQLHSDIPADPDYGLLLKYPSDFMENLISGDVSLQCSSVPDVSICEFVWPRQVLLAGFKFFIPAWTYVQISIYGIQNCAAGQTGQIAAYFYKLSTSVLTAYSETAGSLLILPPPDLLHLNFVNSTVARISAQADFSFSFNTGNHSLSNGYLLVDWPQSIMSIITKPKYLCSEVITGVELDCEWIGNYGYKRTDVLKIDLSQDYRDFNIVMRQIPTPRVPGSTSLFSLRLFDATIGQVTARSYHGLKSLDHLSFVDFNYSVQLPPNLPRSVIKGTFSDEFSMQLGVPCFYRVKIVPISDNTLLEFLPAELLFQYIYTYSTTFRVGAPMNSSYGSYSLYFTKFENDSFVPDLYSALPQLPIDVLEPNQSLSVWVGDIPLIDRGGVSLPVPVQLENPVFDELILSVLTENPVQNDSVIVLPSQVRFNRGEGSKIFQLKLTNSAVSGSIRYVLSGKSAVAYTLQSSLVEFLVAPQVHTNIRILSVLVEALNRTSAKLSARFSGPVQAFYMCTLAGTWTPTALQLAAQTQQSNSVMQIYGSVFVSAYEQIASIQVNGLQDNTQYRVYVTGQDLRGLLISDMESAAFTTLPSQPPATFSVHTKTLVDSRVISAAVANTLAVPTGLVTSMGIDPAVFFPGGKRRLQSLKYDLILVSNRTQESLRPIKLALGLDSKIATLQKYLPQLDSTQSIANTAAEYRGTRVIVTNLNVTSMTSENVTVKIELNVDGVVYAGVVPEGDGILLGQQLVAGLDPSNVALPEGHWTQSRYTYGYECTLHFTNLKPRQQYRIWVTGETDVPDHYDLMKDYDMGKFSFTPGTVGALKGALVTMKDAALALTLSWLFL